MNSYTRNRVAAVGIAAVLGIIIAAGIMLSRGLAPDAYARTNRPHPGPSRSLQPWEQPYYQPGYKPTFPTPPDGHPWVYAPPPAHG